jgi:hypothetical protein
MRRTTLLAIGALTIALATGFGPASKPAQARVYSAAWCAVFYGDGNQDCSYLNQRQCLTAISGVGGICQRNVGYISKGPPPTPVLRLGPALESFFLGD